MSNASNSRIPNSRDGQSGMKALLTRQTSCSDAMAQVVVCKRLAKMPLLFLTVSMDLSEQNNGRHRLSIEHLAEASTNAQNIHGKFPRHLQRGQCRSHGNVDIEENVRIRT